MNSIWCPSIDKEMHDQMDVFIKNFPETNEKFLEGGARQLGDLNPLTDKLYIIAHGHSQMPIFKCDNQLWTANELVELLSADGLPANWRDIELLVCNAGASVNSVKVGNKLLAIQQQAQKLKAQGVATGSEQMDRLAVKHKKAAVKGQEAPSAFTSHDQLLPLAAQFTQALKNHQYTHFRVISYAAPVAQYFHNGTVKLNLAANGGRWGEEATQYPTMMKIWH